MTSDGDVKTRWRTREWFPKFDERIHERLRIYHLELLRWTKTINLISPASVPFADLTHFADSILGAQFVLKDMGNPRPVNEIWDLGSGNGFPGVVFGILQPNLGVICVEADERKAAFLKQLSLRLELENLGVRRERVENLPAEAIGVAVARGFAPVGRALSMTAKQVGPGGLFYHFKGVDWLQEVKSIEGRVSALWETGLLEKYVLNLDPSVGEESDGPNRVIVKSRKKV